MSLNFKLKKKIYIFLFVILNSCAHVEQTNNIELTNQFENDTNFYDALKIRDDISLSSNKRILYTSIINYNDFEIMYRNTNMQLGYVIRDQLHTAIYLNQKKNYLKSMDGSIFDLTQGINATLLTEEVISVIGKMYYGSSEVESIGEN